MNRLRKFDRCCAAAEKAVAVILFAALVLLIFLNITARSLFEISFHRIGEFVPSLVLWLALVGASLALRENRHIKIELVLRFCSGNIQRAARRATDLFGMVVMAVLFYASLEFVRNEVAIFGPMGGLSVIFSLFFAVSSFRFMLRAIDPSGGGAPPGPPIPSSDSRRDPSP